MCENCRFACPSCGDELTVERISREVRSFALDPPTNYPGVAPPLFGCRGRASCLCCTWTPIISNAKQLIGARHQKRRRVCGACRCTLRQDMLVLIVPHGQGDLAADRPVVRSCSHCRAILCRPLRLGTIVSGCSAILPFSNQARLSKQEARPPVPRSCPAINLLIICHEHAIAAPSRALVVRPAYCARADLLWSRQRHWVRVSSRGSALSQCLYPPDISWSLYRETGTGSHWNNDLTAVSTSCCSWSRTGSRA
jgi:hypothetical protein